MAGDQLYPLFAALLAAWGLIDCFFGYRVFRFTVVLLGLLVGALFGTALAEAFLPNQPTAYWLMALAFGLLGGGLAFTIYLAAVFLLGFSAGLAVAAALFVTLDATLGLVLAVLVGLLCGGLALAFQRIAITLATALLGSVRVALGLAYFVSGIDWEFYLRAPDQLPGLFEANLWMVAVAVPLSIAGAVVQFARAGRRKPVEKEKV
jgi:hypothetical protein